MAKICHIITLVHPPDEVLKVVAGWGTKYIYVIEAAGGCRGFNPFSTLPWR